MTAVQEWNSKSHNLRRKDKNRGILRNIDRQLAEREEKGMDQIEIIWVPSHTEGEGKDHQKNANTNRSATEKV
jgi:hypothetical protein